MGASFILIALLLISQYRSVYQPLQLAQPVYMYMVTNSNITHIQYPVVRSTKLDILFCFSHSSIVMNQSSSSTTNGTTSTGCTLEQKSTQYYCIRLFNTNGVVGDVQQSYKNLTSLSTSDSNSKRSVSSDNIQVGPLQPQTSISDNFKSRLLQNFTLTLQAEAENQIIVVDGFFEQNNIYRMYTCPVYLKQSGTCSEYWKQNYVQTYRSSKVSKKINMIVQRKHHCGNFQNGTLNATNHIFYGGTIRQGKFIMFVSILTYLSNQNQLLKMWGGFSYSYDHANRDMYCFSTDGSAFDAISLLVGPIYQDTASNIKGTDDTTIVDNYFKQESGHCHMHFIQYHRIYDTSDNLGDQRLFRKIYDSFGYAAYFQQVPTGTTIYVSPSCIDSNYKHNFIMKMTADVSAFLLNLKYSLPLLLLICFIFIFY